MRPATSPRVAILGGGSIGRRHATNLRALGATDVVVFDPDAEARREAERIGGVTTVDTLDDVWSLRPEVAVIAAPSSLHAELALAAARHGCHLFVEKPLAHSVDRLDELATEVAHRALVTMVGCNMRFHPGPACVKALLDERAIGRVLFARVFGGSYLPEWRPWQDYRRSYSARASLGGGVVLDGIHEIDLACWYVGDARSVAGLASHVSDLELDGVEDVASLIVQHASGAHSEVHLDYVQRVRLRGCVIAGTDGTIAWDWTEHAVRVYRASTRRWDVEPLPPDWEVNRMYVDEMEHFLDAVRIGKPTCNPVADAVKVTRVALAAKRASIERRFVEISEDDR